MYSQAMRYKRRKYRENQGHDVRAEGRSPLAEETVNMLPLASKRKRPEEESDSDSFQRGEVESSANDAWIEAGQAGGAEAGQSEGPYRGEETPSPRV